MTTFTGTIPTIASGDTTTVPTNLATYRDALKAVSEAWTSYTPTWTASVNPAIGNGTRTGKYIQVNKLVTFRIQVTMGSTTTYGTGNWVFSLPVATHSDYASGMMMGNALAFDTSAPSFTQVIPVWLSSTSIHIPLGNGTNTDVSATSPFTWASGDKLTISGTYEAA